MGGAPPGRSTATLTAQQAPFINEGAITHLGYANVFAEEKGISVVYNKIKLTEASAKSLTLIKCLPFPHSGERPGNTETHQPASSTTTNGP